jgi:hypothetical protein
MRKNERKKNMMNGLLQRKKYLMSLDEKLSLYDLPKKRQEKYEKEN